MNTINNDTKRQPRITPDSVSRDSASSSKQEHTSSGQDNKTSPSSRHQNTLSPNSTASKDIREFASMDPNKQQEIAHKRGKVSHGKREDEDESENEE